MLESCNARIWYRMVRLTLPLWWIEGNLSLKINKICLWNKRDANHMLNTGDEKYNIFEIKLIIDRKKKLK